MARLVSVSAIPKTRSFVLSLNTAFLIFLFFFFASNTHLPQPSHLNQPQVPILKYHDHKYSSRGSSCRQLPNYKDNRSKCGYVSSDSGCKSEAGYINYLQLFYCTCGDNVFVGYLLLIIWLVVLFYLLANTAAEYFCSSLEDLSKLLGLSPTVAGVTLLSLGNGAPDVFSSIVSFVGPKEDEIGFNSVLGGAFFVSSVVVGVIGVAVGPKKITVDKAGFVRDICFLLITLLALLGILLIGRLTLWGAIGFLSIYFVYVFVVSFEQVFHKRSPTSGDDNLIIACKSVDDFEELEHPLLEKIDHVKDIRISVKEEGARSESSPSNLRSYLIKFLVILELPLYLPRRLTIPVVSDDKWSKPFAVASVTLAPLLLAALWTSQSEQLNHKDKMIIYLVGGLAGFVLGVSSYLTTTNSNPPRRLLIPWLAGGFLMSVVWTYITAEELVSLLVSIGTIMNISPSILGVTVLAWGNSLGDLIANVAMSMKGGSDGVQVAIAGCYAGPIFNILVGLGLSLNFSIWSIYPLAYDLPKDKNVFQSLGFLVGGLLWAGLILQRRGMKLDVVLGGGLLAIYLCFLSLSLAQTIGLVD